VRPEVVVLGAGPAGLTAAYELSRAGMPATVVEKDALVGGLARTVCYKGFRFDIGGHRFFTKIPEVRAIWQELLGDELRSRPRLSRIYYRNRFFHYPLRPVDALRGLGVIDTGRIVTSYLWAKAFPSREEANFEQWVSNRFGARLYSIFFKAYTEKVWGIPCTEIDADWAAQRIQNLSLGSAIRSALLPGRRGAVIKTLIDQFEYPRLGPGQMWEQCRKVIQERGHDVLMGHELVRIHHAQDRVTAVTVRDGAGGEQRLPATHVISSLALTDVIESLSPAAPDSVREAARRLRYRDFLTVALVIDRAELFPDNWLYIHSPEVRLGRIQNYKNWSPDMVADPGKSCLGLEYFVWENQGEQERPGAPAVRGEVDLWSMQDEELLELGARELVQLGLVQRREVSDGVVVRMRRAYPIYDQAYLQAVAEIRAYLDTLPNLQQVGRNGQHRYNNQDHSMLTALLAARNVLGEQHDIWDVNLEPEYQETLERAQPRRTSPPVRPRARKKPGVAAP
jgi:protoporphyrinogen oxidase